VQQVLAGELGRSVKKRLLRAASALPSDLWLAAGPEDCPRRRYFVQTMVTKVAATVLAALGLAGASPAHQALAKHPAKRTPHTRAARTQALPVLFVVGHGWGHGVGLAQYGAYGYALHGWSSDEIVAHYFPGTDLGDAQLHRLR